ncbi:hypothetical protein PM082_018352 [Marasmius tenuissimus]|nr:hypothetical protein PM082_018352 [Marasmius tenuissimus]
MRMGGTFCGGWAAEVLTALSLLTVVDAECTEILVVEKHQHTESYLTSLASPHLVRNRPVLLKGRRELRSWENGLREDYLEDLYVENFRQCEVLDFARYEEDSLRGEPQDSEEDVEYEEVAKPLEGSDRWYHPAEENMEERHRENLPFATVMNLIARKNGIRYVLDLPTSHQTGIPYSSLDHFDRALDNTKTHGEALVWRDGSWGLMHDGQVVTWWHHDADGKMTVVNAETGAKIWTLFIPDASLPPTRVQDIYRWMAQSKDRLPKQCFGSIVNILLLPGDTLIMPPGMMHLVYTPVPSIFRGSSFWNFNSLHLTAFSLRGDGMFADSLTNVDHDYKTVFHSLVRMAVAMPIIQAFDVREIVIYALYDMIINFQDYTFVGVKDRDYPTSAVMKIKAMVKPNDCEKQSRIQEELRKIKDRRAQALRKTPCSKLAIQVLEGVIAAHGRDIPRDNDSKSQASRKWVDKFWDAGKWSIPGDMIEINLEGLRQLVAV